MASAPVIRRASSAERSDVIRTVVAAFARDPAWAFITNDEYERLSPEFAGALFDLRVISGTVWVSDDLASVAMWNSPGRGDGSPQLAEEVWARYGSVAGQEAHERL